MERLLVLLMIATAAAFAALLGKAAARRESDAEPGNAGAPRGKEAIAVVILREIAMAGGATPERAASLAPAPEGAGRARRIDVTSWAETFARRVSEMERVALLESAVKLAVSMNPSLPPRQYHALQDLSFGLGFHADALARLRARWRFEYADYARVSRPRAADRSSGSALRRRVSPGEKTALMKVLDLSGELEKPALIAAYRRQAAAAHPDRVHGRGESERDAAARRFIEVTEAYETLLTLL